ncbi:MAG: CcmD family protein [Sphingobacteriia bacterium]|nr:MAG: CcmD family protein [Sphingobacteriia bacterium]
MIQAQSTPDVGIMRSNGKILVVMSVVVIIMVGLFIYLLSIDRKITGLEKRENRK